MTALRVLGIVPARAGSKRVAKKNLRVVGGKPLVRWALDAALAAESLARVVCSSDDPEVLAIAESIDPGMVLRRPAALATDTALAVDYVRHAIAELGETFDAICIVQPTSPFTRGSDIDATVALLAASGADSAVTVMPLDHAIHPSKLKRLEGDRLVGYLEVEEGTAAHQLPELYVRNCAVYVTRPHVIDSGRILGADCRGHVMPRERSIDINDELDLAIAEVMLKRMEET